MAPTGRPPPEVSDTRIKPCVEGLVACETQHRLAPDVSYVTAAPTFLT
jgi:hypothetical protein